MATIDPIPGPPPEFDINRVPAVDRHPPRKKGGEERPKRRRPQDEDDAARGPASDDDPFAIDVYEPGPRTRDS